MDQENVSAALTVAVPATRVLAVLADLVTHAAIDRTGWVQEAADRAPVTEVGQISRMDMYHPGHPDGDYQTVNKVQVLDPPRAIGWLTGQEKGDGQLERMPTCPGGRPQPGRMPGAVGGFRHGDRSRPPGAVCARAGLPSGAAGTRAQGPGRLAHRVTLAEGCRSRTQVPGWSPIAPPRAGRQGPR